MENVRDTQDVNKNNVNEWDFFYFIHQIQINHFLKTKNCKYYKQYFIIY